MKVLHVAPAFFPATYWGGPTYSVYGLCNALVSIPGLTLKVLTTDTAGPRIIDRVPVRDFPLRYPAGYDVYFCRRLWHRSVSPGLLLKLWPMIHWADVVHLTGVYSWPTIPTLLVCRVLNKPVVWSPRGALQRWEGSRRPFLKRLWELVCNALINRNRAVLHLTKKEEAQSSQPRIPRAAMTIIPNGVDIPDCLISREWLPSNALRLLFIGRLDPIKGLEALLHAVEQLHDQSITLTVCGTGDPDYVAKLKAMTNTLGLERQVVFRGHVDGADKSEAFSRSDVCVVPSFSENFGMVVAEALAHEVPVIAGKGTPWSDLESRACGLWVENSAMSLASSLRRIRTMDLMEMGRCGRAWMQESYGWGTIAREIFEVYGNLVNDSS